MGSRRTTAGTLFAFGSNAHGELGTGSQLNESVPVAVPALRSLRVVQIAAGGSHAAAITETGELFTWGSSEYGQCGHGSRTMEKQPRLVEGLRGKAVVQVACGLNHTMCLTEYGEVFSWGANAHGQLGHGMLGDVLAPRRVDSLARHKAIQVACGGAHSLILLERGQVYSCGSGRDGRLGHGNEENQLVPVPMDSVAEVVMIAVAAGADFSLLLNAQGDVYACGRSTAGQLGTDSTARQPWPIPVPALQGRRIVRLATHQSHTIAITERGVVLVWGWGDAGQLGIGKGGVVAVPRELPALGDRVAVAAAAGGLHSALITDDGTLYTFGENSSGQLGHGHDRMVLVPRAVKALQGVSVSQVACGGAFTLVLVR